MAKAGSWRVGLVTADSFRGETRIVCKPAHVYGVIERGVGRRSERCRGVEYEFDILFVAHNDAGGTWAGFGK